VEQSCWEGDICWAIWKLRAMCSTQRLITVFIWTISWKRWIQFTLLHPVSFHFYTKLFQEVWFLQVFLPKYCMHFLYVKCAAGLIFLSSQYLITWRLFGEEDQLGSSLLYSFLQPPAPFNQILIGLASFMHKLYSVRTLHNWMVSLL